jgi:hypothetical protein
MKKIVTLALLLALPKEYGRSGGTIIFSASDHRPKRNAMEGGFAPYI